MAQADELLQANYTRFEKEGTEGTVTRTLGYTLPEEVERHVVAIYPTVGCVRVLVFKTRTD